MTLHDLTRSSVTFTCVPNITSLNFAFVRHILLSAVLSGTMSELHRAEPLLRQAGLRVGEQPRASPMRDLS